MKTVISSLKCEYAQRIYCLSSYENNSDFDIAAAISFIIKPLEEWVEVVR